MSGWWGSVRSAWRQRACIVATVAMGGTTLVGGGPVVAQSGTASTVSVGGDSWDTFQADVRIRRSRVKADGAPAGPSIPAVEYQWKRVLTGSRWKTTVMAKQSGAAVVRSLNGLTQLNHPLAAVRMEDDEDGSPLRFYNDRGQQIRWPSDEQLRRALPGPGPGTDRSRRALSFERLGADPSWANELVVPVAARRERLLALSDRFGREAGRVRGFIRYLRSEGDTIREVLVDQDQAVPVEMSLVRGGLLVSHTRFSYSPPAGGSIVRQGIRTEELVPEGGGDRLVAEIELTNVKLERRGGVR